MERRGVLVRLGSVLLILPAARALSACGGDGGKTGQGGPAGTPDSGDGGSRTYTSSVTGGHTHDFTLEMSEITSPPAGGISRDTTYAVDHDHEVELTEAELDTIGSGGTVTKVTGETNGHTHTFTFVRA